MGLGKQLLRATDHPEFMKARQKRGAARLEGVKNLGELERQVDRGNSGTYIIKILDQPRSLPSWEGLHVVPIFMSMEEPREFPGELGRRSIETTNPLYRSE